jgi:hypothetical protein
MKTKLLFIALLISTFINAQSITFTSTLTEAQIGTTVTINYEYTIPADGNIYCAINLYDDSTWSSKVADGSLSPALAGTNVTGSFDFTIPSGTTQTADLTGNFNYKLVIELSNAAWDWQAGDYPTTQINLTNSALSLDTFEDSLKQISLYPNPVSESLYIKNLNNLNISNIRILNILGKVVQTKSALNKNQNIDVSKLTSGIYILTIQSESSSKSIKFVKQ